MLHHKPGNPPKPKVSRQGSDRNRSAPVDRRSSGSGDNHDIGEPWRIDAVEYPKLQWHEWRTYPTIHVLDRFGVLVAIFNNPKAAEAVVKCMNAKAGLDDVD